MERHLSKWIIAHRGARFEAPENTRPAFDIALTHPIDGIELDVQLTKDGIPVLYHDRTLSKLNDKRKRLSDYAYVELQKKSWKSWGNSSYRHEPLITLGEALRCYCKRTRMFIEIKSRDWDRSSGRSIVLTKHVIKSIRKFVPKQYLKNIFILSFDRFVLDVGRQLEPNWRYIWNLSEPILQPNLVTSQTENLYGVCIPIRKLTGVFVKRVHSNCKMLVTYGCNTSTHLKCALTLNADIIMTDKPRWLVGHLNQQGHTR